MRIFLSFITLFFSACVTSRNAIPEWVNNPHAGYLSDKYLVAVGEGTARSAAADSAKAELFAFIRQQVTTSTSSSYQATVHDENYQISQTMKATSSFNSVVGVRVAETCNADGIFYALAVLDKAQATMYYTRRIEEHNTEIEKLRSMAGENYSMEGFLRLHRAVSVAEEARDCYDILNAVNPISAKATFQISPRTLEIEAATYGEKIHITAIAHLYGEIEDKGRLYSAMEKSLGKSGLKILFDNEKTVATPYKLETTVTVIPMEPKNEMVFARYELISNLVEVKNGKVLFSFSRSKREAHVDKLGLHNRIMRSIEEDFATDFFGELEEKFSI